MTAWEPPRRFAYADPVFATEFLVTARGQGSCVVRVIRVLAIHTGGIIDSLPSVAVPPPRW